MPSTNPPEESLAPSHPQLPCGEPQSGLSVLWLAVLTVALSFGWFFLDGNVGINLADEGFLWYGSEAMKEGHVPIRDFQAYDPGRYLWVSAWSYLLGDGITGLRAACVLLQCIAVFSGTLVARRVSRDWKFLLLVTLILTLWMFPRYKVFEQSISLLGIYIAITLIENPTSRRHLLAGFFVGLMAFVGRNHGLYLFCSFGTLIMILAWSRRWESFRQTALAWAGGICIGYAPQLLMFAFVPGYLDAYLGVLRYDLSMGTNIPLPIPWPWTVPPAFFKHTGTTMFIINYLAEGTLYVLSVLFIPAALIRLVRIPRTSIRKHSVLLAASCIFVTYTHHTFSRADYVHLAHSMPALALGLIGFACTLQRGAGMATPAVAVTFSALTFASVYPHTSSYFEAHGPKIGFVDYRVGKDEMRVPTYTHRLLVAAKRISEELAGPDDSVLFLPHIPGLYPATNRLSPTKQIYFMLPASAEDDANTLGQIRANRVRWVLLQDFPLDGRDELRFSRTNPLTTKYFMENFRLVPFPDLPRNTVLLRLEE